MELLFAPFALMIAVPGAGLLPGMLLLLGFVRRRKALNRFQRNLLILVILAWLVYGCYETRMYFWMQTVSAPIRVDLLLIAPFLTLLTVWVAVVLIRTRPRRTGPSHNRES